ncbi:hypothetical protein ACLOJK_015603 [Asimina triloba]
MSTGIIPTRPPNYDADANLGVAHAVVEGSEEEEHGKRSVFKMVKDQARKIKHTLGKKAHGKGSHEQQDDAPGPEVEGHEEESNKEEPEVHGAPIYESEVVQHKVRGGGGGEEHGLKDTEKELFAESLKEQPRFEEEPHAPKDHDQPHPPPNYQAKVADPTASEVVQHKVRGGGGGGEEHGLKDTEKELFAESLKEQPRFEEEPHAPKDHDQPHPPPNYQAKVADPTASEVVQHEAGGGEHGQKDNEKELFAELLKEQPRFEEEPHALKDHDQPHPPPNYQAKVADPTASEVVQHEVRGGGGGGGEHGQKDMEKELFAELLQEQPRFEEEPHAPKDHDQPHPPPNYQAKVADPTASEVGQHEVRGGGGGGGGEHGQKDNEKELFAELLKEQPRFEEEPHAPKDHDQPHPPPNYQAKVADPTAQGGSESGDALPDLDGSLRAKMILDESTPPAGSHGQSRTDPDPASSQNAPPNPQNPDSPTRPSQPSSSNAEKISPATSGVAQKAAAAKDLFPSKLHPDQPTGESYGWGFAEKLAPFYGRVTEAGGAVVAKMSPRGGKKSSEAESPESKVKVEETETETGAGLSEAGAKVRESVAEKPRPGDEHKAASEAEGASDSGGKGIVETVRGAVASALGLGGESHESSNRNLQARGTFSHVRFLLSLKNCECECDLTRAHPGGVDSVSKSGEGEGEGEGKGEEPKLEASTT